MSNTVVFRDSDFAKEGEVSRIGTITPDGGEVYGFEVACTAETPEMISYLENTDFSKYAEYIENPKTGKNNKLVWFERLKLFTDRLNG